MLLRNSALTSRSANRWWSINRSQFTILHSLINWCLLTYYFLDCFFPSNKLYLNTNSNCLFKGDSSHIACSWEKYLGLAETNVLLIRTEWYKTEALSFTFQIFLPHISCISNLYRKEKWNNPLYPQKSARQHLTP